MKGERCCQWKGRQSQDSDTGKCTLCSRIGTSAIRPLQLGKSPALTHPSNPPDLHPARH